MRCPSCEAEQPDGVTICGFCGSAMVRLPAAAEPAEIESFGGAAARSEATSGRWLLAGLAFILLGGGWFAWREVSRSAELEVQPPTSQESPAPDPGATPPSAAAPATPPVPSAETEDAAGGRLDEGDLWRLADDLDRLTFEGDHLELARRLEPGLRYRSEVIDAGEVRRLDGGMPELLAHWLTPLWIDRIEGLGGGSFAETVAVEVGAGGRSGTIERSLDTSADPSRATFPVPLLMRLARGIPISHENLSDLELARVWRESAPCHVDERLQVELTSRGLRVVGATRSGRCGL